MLPNSENSKHITFVIPAIGFGGAETQLLNQVNYLYRAGYQVSLIVFTRFEKLRESLEIPEENVLVLHKTMNYLGAKSVLEARSMLVPILQFLRQKKSHTVVANLPIAHFVMRLVKLLGKASNFSFCLLQYHHSVQYEESPLNSLPKKAFNSFNAWLANLTDNGNIFISEEVKENISQFFPAKNAFVIPNAVPWKRVTNEPAEQYLTRHTLQHYSDLLVIPGRLNDAKGHSFFLKAFRKFLQQTTSTSGKPIFVIFAGGGPLYDFLEEQVLEFELRSNVHITGQIENDLLLSLMQKSDLVVIPSIHEGFGLVAIEALMVKSLLLTSKAGGLPGIVRDGENGFLFEVLQEDDLISKLNYILKNKENLNIDRELLQREFREKYGFEQHIGKLVNAINATCR